jgi:hypothetical protein
LFTLLTTLNDMLDANTAPWEARRCVAVLQVTRIRGQVGIASGGLVLTAAYRLFALDFRFFTYVEKGI